jgi:hypothetical protein
VLDVFLVRPYDLHGAVDLFGNLDGANDAVDFEVAIKAPTDRAQTAELHSYEYQSQVRGVFIWR